MDARPVQWAEPALFSFLRIADEVDRAEVRAETDRIEAGREQTAVPVPFEYPQRSYLVATANWFIIVEDRSKVWLVTHVFRADVP